MNDFDPPVLLVAFEIERAPRPVNANTLTEEDLRRIVDWIASHERIDFETWLGRHLLARRLRQTA